MSKTSDFKELKELLSRLGLSQAWAAKQLGVSAAYVGNVLVGKMEPGEELTKQIIDLRDKLKRSGLRAV